MLLRGRVSRILHMRKFFDYPISLNLATLRNLGLQRTMKVGFSYLRARFFPIREERSLEDFFINRFGRELYLSFFQDYTEKVWGVPCNQIKPEWGAQRVKGLSVGRALAHAARRACIKDTSLAQKSTETSLIERFLYPKFGPGQLWEEVARIIGENGGEIHRNQRVVGIRHDAGKVVEVEVEDQASGERKTRRGDYFFSSMPIKDLIAAMGDEVPAEVRRVAQGLVYRDFITVGLLLKRLKIRNDSGIRTVNGLVPDNWIYIQEPGVKIGRLQIFNNWSPYLVSDEDKVWVGLEYFCNEGDDLWNMPDEEFARFAAGELASIDIIDLEDVLDWVVIRMPKTYPAYFGTYEQIHVVRDFTDSLENLFLIGRNGMHRYNNQDHSMLTAMIAVDNIIDGVRDKSNIWAVNAEEEYLEEKMYEGEHEKIFSQR
jgi:protoporphyrinogen oxidase